MTEHVSTSRMESFCLSALSEAELATITDHLTQCRSCHQLFADILREQRGSVQLTFPLEPESWLRHDHIEFESLRKIADNELDDSDREMIDVHLSTCTGCREDVASFLAFTKQIEPELLARYGPAALKPTRDATPWWDLWGGLAWKPAYTAAVVLVGIAVVIGAALLLRRNQNLRTQQIPTPASSPGSTPNDRIVGISSPSVSPTESPEPSRGDGVVTLNDRGGTITVDRAGNVSGLEDVPSPTRDEVAQLLLTQQLEPPAILKELRGQGAALRGSGNTQPFKLLYPSRTVIISNRPTLKWEKAAGATAYKVYVTDQAGNEVARSEELSSDLNYWSLPERLKRGEIYNWTVVAVVDGKEIVSPGPSAQEMRFQVMSATNLRQLSELKRVQSHLALGFFYAKVGLIPEAEKEFQILVRKNPDSSSAKRLLRQIQTLHGPQ